ncbi:NAD-binding protein [Dendrothele bispora CBS 962.96]|uniref:NAD-binding protein n=1 Tax=Dendrothele bispora (strain CBS 962.96) TaxID=1314807 RepID=A0A4S8M7Y8_DENBC|nr:NAD-binding protein [Dendrothele bispora CBS 962.96]
MTGKTKVLITGITGYIGGSVFCRLMQRPDFSSFDFRAIVRSTEKAEKLKTFGVTPIVGSHSDIELMSKAASEVDMVIATADSDDLQAVEGTLLGLKGRFEETGEKPIFINTSGTGLLVDNAAGMYPGQVIYDDADPDQIETLPASQPHRSVDLKIVAGDKDGYVSTYIVLPPTIWNIATGPLFEAGIANPRSIQIPSLVRASLDRGRGGMVGKGANIWHNVDVHELADLYNLLLDAVLSPTASTNLGHGREGFYFGANEEHKLYDVAKAIAENLVAEGKAKESDPTTFTKEEIVKYFPQSDNSEHNSRCRSTRARALGWLPKRTTQDMLASIKAEVEVEIKNGRNPASKRL